MHNPDLYIYIVTHKKSFFFFFNPHVLIIHSLLCSVKSVAQEQKTEIMSQLQTIRCLMKKRGMECPPLNSGEVAGTDGLTYLKTPGFVLNHKNNKCVSRRPDRLEKLSVDAANRARWQLYTAVYSYF